ncbi:MAG: caspase family protein [Campylobacterales bacterium]|nr:caspase family protein [Campylobacterales bacterium]
MWTEEGYFTSSPDGVQYLYFHLNQGYDKEALAIPMKSLYDHFFRPDLVKLKLSGDEAEYQKATKGMTYKEALSNPPPKITFERVDGQKLNKTAFEYDKVTIKKRHAKLIFGIKEHDKGGIGLIRVYQEGKLIQTIGDGQVNKSAANVDTKLEQEKQDKVQKKKQDDHIITVAQANISSSSPKDFTRSIDINLSITDTIASTQTITTTNREGNYTIDLELVAGNNEIAIEAFNKTNTVASFRETMNIEANITKKEPKLYAIVVGINSFKENNEKWKLKYSKNDAQDIKKAIETKMNRLYQDINVTLLTDEKVTKESIIGTANSIAKQAKLEDTIVVYISTHGRASEGRLYLAPYNNGHRDNWIDFEKTFQTIQSIKALNQIFILDTCESGQANDIVSSVYDSRASVLARSSGVHMLLSTTKGTYAFESSDPNIKNGVFTYRILQTMQDKSSDSNKDGIISIVELSNKLKETQNNPDYQQPIIRNVGGDVGLIKIRN